MAYLNRVLHRRPRKEQDVVAMLRGERQELRNADQKRVFDQLRSMATERGLFIQDGGTAYLGDDELLLLSWLAAAQRPTSERLVLADAQMTAVITECAKLLTEAGTRLHPLTLYQRHLNRTVYRGIKSETST